MKSSKSTLETSSTIIFFHRNSLKCVSDFLRGRIVISSHFVNSVSQFFILLDYK